uniref:Polymerase nucleotidyl transferase domain-containing protein n=1 Tax=Acrobeloides nanus TaxID=290746 RepID=A0A914C2F0_9BILA
MLMTQKSRVELLNKEVQNGFIFIRKSYVKQYKRQKRSVAELKRALTSFGNIVVPVGSFVTRASPKSSDVDIVLLSTFDESKMGRKDEEDWYNSRMNEIKRILKNDEFCRQFLFKRFEKILRHNIRVPILRLQPFDFSMDIQFDMDEAIRNSLFVKHCVMLDERVAYLNHWLSNLFLLCGIKDSRNGLFSSYHLLSLVIHFMQYQQHQNMKPILPVIACRTEPIIYKSPNEMCVGELILRFIDFYSNLELENIMLDAAKGQNFPREASSSLKMNQIWLSDPYSSDVIYTTGYSSLKLFKGALSKAREAILIPEPFPVEHFMLL